MAKQHGSIAHAGRVREKTPKVAKKEKRRKSTHRALKRKKYELNFKDGEKIEKQRKTN